MNKKRWNRARRASAGYFLRRAKQFATWRESVMPNAREFAPREMAEINRCHRRLEELRQLQLKLQREGRLASA